MKKFLDVCLTITFVWLMQWKKIYKWIITSSKLKASNKLVYAVLQLSGPNDFGYIKFYFIGLKKLGSKQLFSDLEPVVIKDFWSWKTWRLIVHCPVFSIKRRAYRMVKLSYYWTFVTFLEKNLNSSEKLSKNEYIFFCHNSISKGGPRAHMSQMLLVSGEGTSRVFDMEASRRWFSFLIKLGDVSLLQCKC